MRIISSLSSAILILVLSSHVAVAGQPAFGDYTAKGFLSNYSKLAPEGGESKAYRYRDISRLPQWL